MTYTDLQLREVFHLEFLKSLGSKVKAKLYVLKGGVNLRFFYNSMRYSEDMDLDVQDIEVVVLKDKVMQILASMSFHERLVPFGIKQVTPPNMNRAKQTETTLWFKIHLLTRAGEDLFTKIEFSRRGFAGTIQVHTVADTILSQYKSAPVLVPHYDKHTAFLHKINAIAGRAVIQARDIFDLYVLSTQVERGKCNIQGVPEDTINTAKANIFSIGFEQFRDTVLSYISLEDQRVYDNKDAWDEVRIKVVACIDTAASRG